MKRCFMICIMVFLVATLLGCTATKRNNFLSKNYTEESWQRAIDRDPNWWKRGADHWFLTADANETEELNKKAPAISAMSTMSVAVPEFNNIKIDGGFQTQIYGTLGHNTVDVYGPNAGVSSLTVDVMNNGIYIHAHPNASPAVTKVIVRIGIKHLKNLIQMGCGHINVIQVTSRHLTISSAAKSTGDVYLSGCVRLTRVDHAGSGTITVFGADTRHLSIQTCGKCGGVNVYGNVGVRSIVHHGNNDINIIGANSPSLSIFANGAGKIGIKGFVRLGKVETHDYTRVYVSQTASRRLYADAFDCSDIGLTGSVGNLFVNTSNTARFQGRTLCAQNAYARSIDESHINITACNRAFGKAYDLSSIYFFGPDYLLSRFTKGKGLVMAVGGRTWCNRASEFRSYDYTDMHKQASRFVGAG